jgi:hypothetical protein
MQPSTRGQIWRLTGLPLSHGPLRASLVGETATTRGGRQTERFTNHEAAAGLPDTAREL